MGLANVSALAHHGTFVSYDGSKALTHKAVVTEFHTGSYRFPRLRLAYTASTNMLVVQGPLVVP